MVDFLAKRVREYKIEVDEFKAHLKDDLNEVHLIISPHFDDTVLSLGGFLASAQSKQIYIINIFGGKPKIPISSKWDRKCGFKNSGEAVPVRIAEDEIALSFLGISESNRINYNYLDRQYRDKLKEKYFSQNELETKIKIDLLSFLSKHRGKTFFIYVPIVSKHVDHKIVTSAVMSMISDINNCSVYFYQDILYTASLISENNNDFLYPKKSLEKELKIRVKPLYIKVDKQANKKKKKAIKFYRSQYPKLKPHLKRANKVVKKQLKFFSILEKSSEIIYSLDNTQE